MTNFFSVPDKEKNYQGYMVYVLSILWSVVTGAIVSVGFVFFPELWTRWLTFVCVSLFIAVTNLAINRAGYHRAASWSLSIMIWIYITVPCYSAGGIMAPGIMSQMSVILTAGFLLGWSGGLAFGLLSMGTDFALAYMEMTGNLPQPSVMHNPITRWIGAIIPFGTILALQYYATNHLRTSLHALHREIGKREEAEAAKDNMLRNLKERMKELNTLYTVSRILQQDDALPEKLFAEIVEILPAGWQYPNVTAARICIAGKEYPTKNFAHAEHSMLAEMMTANGVNVGVEVVYLKPMPEVDEGPFLKEERSLINMLADMLTVYLEQKERTAELRDYKFALDMASLVSISGVDACFSFVNDNFCKASMYNATELLGIHHSVIWSGHHSAEYFDELKIAMRDGRPFRGEFCNKTKDGTLYWVDTTIVPFVDGDGNVYQYLSINHDITERKNADEKIRASEQLLRKVTSQVPGNTYMFEIEESGKSNMLFMNRGTDTFNHSFSFEELSNDPQKFREVLHEDDKVKFNDAMKAAYRTGAALSFQYRIVVDGRIRWRWMQAVPETDKEGRTLWYGATSDITPLVDYLVSTEQIIFDIAHVIRRPIATMLGMTGLISDTDMAEHEIKDYAKHLHKVSNEMDEFIRELNNAYQQKKENTQFNIDISLAIDRRSSLFS